MKIESTVTLVSLSSGFGNVPNNVIPLNTYKHSPANARPGSGYDRVLGTYVLPDGCRAVSDENETNVLSPANTVCTFGEERDGTVWIAWSDAPRSFFFFRVLSKQKAIQNEPLSPTIE